MTSLASFAPYLAVAVLIAVELGTLRPARADATKRDRGSVWVIHVLLSSGMWAAFVLSHGALARSLGLGAWAVPAGLALVLGGAALRLWAIRTLGQFFTRDIQVSAAQTVVDTGPYRLVRHPSYTGSLLEFLGVGLTLGNALGLALAFLPAVAAFAFRIRVEEQVLLGALGEAYRAYRARTKRLVPYLI